MNEFIGSHFIYTYANGWMYELYVKNEHTVDYRIHSGMVGGRWVRHQHVDLVKLTEGVYSQAPYEGMIEDMINGKLNFE